MLEYNICLFCVSSVCVSFCVYGRLIMCVDDGRTDDNPNVIINVCENVLINLIDQLTDYLLK